MKDAEFIELLNLYLDHEISAADAARLEAEVQGDPARRQVYRQYCQMQKACTLLAKDFAEQPAPAVESEKLVAFPARRSAWAPAVWSAAGLATAACVAFVFVSRSNNVTPSAVQPIAAAVPVAQPQVAPPPADASEPRMIARTIAAPARRNELQPVLTARDAQFASTTMETPVQFEWMKTVQLTPIAPAAEELRFEPRSMLKPESPVYRGRRPIQGNVEMTAFQFQK